MSGIQNWTKLQIIFKNVAICETYYFLNIYLGKILLNSLNSVKKKYMKDGKLGSESCRCRPKRIKKFSLKMN